MGSLKWFKRAPFRSLLIMPMMFVWNDSYETGLKEIDAQHKRLVDILNRLFAAMEKGQAKDVLGKLLDELIQYTVVHFGTEERYFKQFGYPEAISHKKEHDDLASKAVALQKDFKAGKAALSVEVGEFLRQWLMKHILGSDKKYAPFLAAKGLR